MVLPSAETPVSPEVTPEAQKAALFIEASLGKEEVNPEQVLRQLAENQKNNSKLAEVT